MAATRTLVVDPILPSWIPELIVRNLRVGDAKVTMRFWREANGAADWEVLHQQGTLHVLRQPAPESLSATWSDRTTAVLESFFKSS